MVDAEASTLCPDSSPSLFVSKTCPLESSQAGWFAWPLGKCGFLHQIKDQSPQKSQPKSLLEKPGGGSSHGLQSMAFST